MTTRCTLPTRVAAFIIMMAALFLATSTGHAQAVDCTTCDHFTIGVNQNLNCSVTICYAVSPVGNIVCKTVPPGRSITIPCPVYQVWVNTCSGPYYIVPSVSDPVCSPILKFAANCCGQVCVAPSPDICTRLEIQPAPCLTPGCP